MSLRMREGDTRPTTSVATRNKGAVATVEWSVPLLTMLFVISLYAEESIHRLNGCKMWIREADEFARQTLAAAHVTVGASGGDRSRPSGVERGVRFAAQKP